MSSENYLSHAYDDHALPEDYHDNDDAHDTFYECSNEVGNDLSWWTDHNTYNHVDRISAPFEHAGHADSDFSDVPADASSPPDIFSPPTTLTPAASGGQHPNSEDSTFLSASKISVDIVPPLEPDLIAGIPRSLFDDTSDVFTDALLLSDAYSHPNTPVPAPPIATPAFHSAGNNASQVLTDPPGIPAFPSGESDSSDVSTDTTPTSIQSTSLTLDSSLLEQYELTSDNLRVDATGFRLRVEIAFIDQSEHDYIPVEIVPGCILRHDTIANHPCVGGDHTYAYTRKRRATLARYIIAQVVEDLSFLSSQVVAYDNLRPSNIITDFAEVKLASFAGARNLSNNSQEFFGWCDYRGESLYTLPEILIQDASQ
ncbi:hypothetical protein BC835DRAFT_1412556 [Cytidiella melzeri]|nr:hypothetical protein BC835DRAFT_1412556 [Cytidiella melzeri]